MKTYFCSTALLFSLFIPAPASADGSTINFVGGVVEAGCTVNVVPNPTVGTQPVAPGINLQIHAENDACSRGYTAFNAQVGTLDAGETGLQNNVITLTYN